MRIDIAIPIKSKGVPPVEYKKMEIDEVFDESEVAQKIEDYLRSRDLLTKRSDPLAIARRYKTAVLTQLGQNYAMRDEQDRKLDWHNVSIRTVRDACGRYGPKGKQEYWWDYLNKTFPLLQIVVKGNNLQEQLSKAKTMFDYHWEQQWVATIKDTIESDPDADQKYTWVDIDIENLGNYMLQRSLVNDTRSVNEASKIMAVAEQFRIDEKWGKLPMLKRPAASGRLYYGGINLQNTPPGVRHAALGKHFSYDLRTSVFAWQISMMRVLFNCDRNTTPPGTSYTREYLTNKERIRNQFDDCFQGTGLTPASIAGIVKQALTAISFGARRSAAYIDNNTNELVAHGLAGIIKHRESRERFLKHPWMTEFLAEQDYITKTIYAAVGDMFKDEPACQYKGRQNEKRTMAFLYQRAEARAMRDLMDRVQDKTPLLWIHDGFCTRHRCNIQDLSYILEQDHAQDWRLEETVHRGWNDPKEREESNEEWEERVREERRQRNQAEMAMWQARGAGINTSLENEIARINLAQIRARQFGY